MGLFLAENIIESGTAPSVEIVIPKNASFLSELCASYEGVRVTELSRTKPGKLFELFSQCRVQTLVLVAPTPGRTPSQVKILAFVLRLFPGNYTVGFKDKSTFPNLYSKELIYDTEKPVHETLLELLTATGHTPRVLVPRLRTKVSSDKQEPYLVIHPRGSSDARSFPVDELATVLAYCGEHLPELSVRVSVSNSDEAYVREAISKAGAETFASVMAGESMGTLIKTLISARGFVGVDTGITHLACFLGVPSLVVAHVGTMNWLPWYAPQATVLYRLLEETVARTDKGYLKEHRNGRLRPFGHVPVDAVCQEIRRMYTA